MATTALLLAIPPIALAINVRWMVENGQVRRIGEYIDTKLWVYLTCHTDSKLPSWEGEIRGSHNKVWSLVMSLSTPLIFAGAAAGSMWGVLATKAQVDQSFVFLGAKVTIGTKPTPINTGLIIAGGVLTLASIGIPLVVKVLDIRGEQRRRASAIRALIDEGHSHAEI